MPRKKLIRTSAYPYHVTSRTRNKDWYEIPLDQVWKIFRDSLLYSCDKHPVDIHAFVLMNNHYHLILSTPDKNIDLFMYELNKTISRRIRDSSGRINQIFGGRYHWTLISHRNYVYNVLRYVFQNPMRAGVSKDCQSYEFSSLNLRFFPIVNLIDEQGYDSFQNWVNEETDDKLGSSLSKKGYLKLPVDINRKKIILQKFSA